MNVCQTEAESKQISIQIERYQWDKVSSGLAGMEPTAIRQNMNNDQSAAIARIIMQGDAA